MAASIEIAQLPLSSVREMALQAVLAEAVKPTTVQRHQWAWKPILAHFGADRPVNEINRQSLLAYIAARVKVQAARATVRLELWALRKALALLEETSEGAYERPRFPRFLIGNNARRGFFEEGEYKKVMAALPDDGLRRYVQFLWFTGWRGPSEVAKLRWTQVDWERGEVRLEAGTTKNGEARVFPFKMFDQLEKLLLEQLAATADLEKRYGMVIPMVFWRHFPHARAINPRLTLGLVRPIGHFHHVWHKACAEAGCPGRIPHDFRRTAVRRLIDAGIPRQVAMQITGHKTEEIFERYNIRDGRDVEAAVSKLAAHMAHGAPVERPVTGSSVLPVAPPPPAALPPVTAEPVPAPAPPPRVQRPPRPRIPAPSVPAAAFPQSLVLDLTAFAELAPAARGASGGDSNAVP